MLPSILDTKSTKTILMIVSTGLISGLVFQYYVKKRIAARRQQLNIVDKKINEVILFAKEQRPIHRSQHSRYLVTESMARLLYYLSSARYTLDICIYLFTNKDILRVIHILHYKGVQIRCIIDSSMAFNSNRAMKTLQELGIPLRINKPEQTDNLVHHKFCLIDGSRIESNCVPLVMTGSLNWTAQALYKNWENVIVTSERDIIEQYKIEFERLWSIFIPVATLDLINTQLPN